MKWITDYHFIIHENVIKTLERDCNKPSWSESAYSLLGKVVSIYRPSNAHPFLKEEIVPRRVYFEIVDVKPWDIESKSSVHVFGRPRTDTLVREKIDKLLKGYRFVLPDRKPPDVKRMNTIKGIIGALHTHEAMEHLSNTDIKEAKSIVSEWLKANALPYEFMDHYLIGLCVCKSHSLYLHALSPPFNVPIKSDEATRYNDGTTLRVLAKYKRDNQTDNVKVVNNYEYDRFFDRIKTYMKNPLMFRKVTVIGAGTAGSQIAINLAKLPIGSIVLIDEDKVEIENIVRQAFNMSQLGMYKVHALKESIERINPWMLVKPYPSKLEIGEITSMNSTSIKEIITSDLVVVAADDDRLIESIDHLTYPFLIPTLYVGFSSKVLTGYVFISIPPFRACRLCIEKLYVKKKSFAKSIDVRLDPTVKYGTTLSGAQGLHSDTSILTSLASRIILQLLRGEFIQYNYYEYYGLFNVNDALELKDVDMSRELKAHEYAQLKRIRHSVDNGRTSIIKAMEIPPVYDCPIHYNLRTCAKSTKVK